MSTIAQWMANITSPTMMKTEPCLPDSFSDVTYPTTPPISVSDVGPSSVNQYHVGVQVAGFLQELCLPHEVNEIDEETRMLIAQAMEERNCLQAEIDLASRRCRQHVYAAHGCALRADKLAVRQDAVTKHVVTTVQAIVDKRLPPDSRSQMTPGRH